MTLAIVLVSVGLYLGLAVLVGRFCGINSAWERVVENTVGPGGGGQMTLDPLESERLDQAERVVDEATTARSEEEEKVSQPV